MHVSSHVSFCDVYLHKQTEKESDLPGKMHVVFIENGRLESITIEAAPTDTVEDVKWRVYVLTNVRMCIQRLHYRFVRLSNSRTLESYGITNESSLELCTKRCLCCERTRPRL